MAAIYSQMFPDVAHPLEENTTNPKELLTKFDIVGSHAKQRPDFSN